MTTDPPPPSSSQRDAFLRELVSALCDLGVEKIDPAAAKPGNGSRPTSLLTDQHRSRARSSASVTPFSSSSLRLARAAHARLQFDHPSLDATAVDALSKAVLELKFVDKIDQRNIALAPTRKLVAALAGDPPSLALPAGDESGGDEAGEADEDKARARALDAAAASSGCWDRLAVSYTVKMVLSVLESLPRPSSCSSSSSTSEAKGPGSSPPPPSALSPLLLLSRLAAELDEEGERAEEEVARRAAAAAAGGGAGGEEVERALAAFLGQHDEEKEEGEGEASDAAAAAPERGERTGEAESDDDSDYDTPLHQEAAAGRGAPVGDGVDPLSAVAAGEDDDDDSAPSSLLAVPPSLPSAVRAMVSLVQAARSRVGRGWGEAGGIELTAACLVAVRRAAAADSEASPPLRRLGTELLLLARDGAVASPLRGAAALPTLLEALGGASSGGSDDDGAPRAPAALADAAELFAAVVAGWPLPSPSSSSSFASSSSESRLALARAWKDSTTGAAGRTTNLLESLAAALLAATGGGSLEGAKRALAELNGDDDSSPPSSPPPSSSSSSSSPSSSYLLGAACSALAALLMASQAAGASAEEVAGGMLGSGAWRSVACLLGAAAASPPGGDVVDDVDDENGGRTRLLPLPRGALEAALLGSASSPELSRYLAASPAGKFVVVEAAKIEGGGSGGVEGAMLSALFAAAPSASEQKNSPFSSAPLARMISASYIEEREVPKGSPSVRWRESARLLREMSRVAGGGGGGGHRWGAEVDAAVASLERALISAAAASSADSEVEVEERIVPAGEEAKKSPEAAHRREALRLASAERRRAAAAAAGVAAASPPSSFYAAAAASAAAPAVTRGKDD